MDIDLISKIKRIAIIALASDDTLVESIVLKGGNAIDLAYYSVANQSSRTSFDLDYSIHGSIDEQFMKNKIESVLKNTFLEYGYIVIDYKFLKKPQKISPEVIDFWGGYKVEFKIIEENKYKENINNIEAQRRNSLTLNPNQSTVFELDFSKYEYTEQRITFNVDGYKIYIYTPEMIVFEKLRAICQQLPKYKEVIKSMTLKARSKDFYDIHHIMNLYNIDPKTADNIALIKYIFSSKKVPVNFIKEIRTNKSIHESDWQSVVDTVSPNEVLNDFNFYFQYVIDQFESIKFP